MHANSNAVIASRLNRLSKRPIGYKIRKLDNHLMVSLLVSICNSGNGQMPQSLLVISNPLCAVKGPLLS